MNRQKQILELADRKGIIEAGDVENMGISRNYLYRMYRDGLLEKIATGLYTVPDAPMNEHSNLAVVAKRMPHAVVCLLSALSYHGITTQLPHEIWLTVPRGSWRPDSELPPLNLTYVSGQAYSFGVEEHIINGVTAQNLQSGKNRRGLLQVPQQGRP